MAYSFSDIDRENTRWFKHDSTVGSLKAIIIRAGEIRGLRRMRLDFEYPITVIAGRNGSGKSTILALAACAYHNRKTASTSLRRKFPYFTFSDFFIQARDEVPVEGISILYGIFHNNWRKTKQTPNKIGLRFQERKKKKGGRWNNYDKRVNRPVVYLGINRLVPHSERSTSRTYCRKFVSTSQDMKISKDICTIASKVLSRRYTDLEYAEHSKYKLPLVSRGSIKYSGFNMGAGEDALFELLYHVFASPRKTMLLVDEIELGLHPEAQKRLMHELKAIVKQRKMQVICTTHSPWILESVPPCGRIFIDRMGKDAICTPHITSDFAMGKLTGEKNPELDILVEDDVANAIIMGLLSREHRRRVKVIPIGSDISIARHLAARFIHDKRKKVIAMFDGDKRGSVAILKNNFVRALEMESRSQPGREWIKDRLYFLPGDTWPEKQLVSISDEKAIRAFSKAMNTPEEEMKQLLLEAQVQGKHREIDFLETQLGLSQGIVLRALVKAYFTLYPDEAKTLLSTVDKWLNL